MSTIFGGRLRYFMDSSGTTCIYSKEPDMCTVFEVLSELCTWKIACSHTRQWQSNKKTIFLNVGKYNAINYWLIANNEKKKPYSKFCFIKQKIKMHIILILIMEYSTKVADCSNLWKKTKRFILYRCIIILIEL